MSFDHPLLERARAMKNRANELLRAKIPKRDFPMPTAAHGKVTAASKLRNLSRGERATRAKSKGNKNLR